MAPLASIPEVNTPLSSSHDGGSLRHRRTTSMERIRPRSRVLIRSRRPARLRRSFGPLRQSSGLRLAYSQRHYPSSRHPPRHSNRPRTLRGSRVPACEMADPDAWDDQALESPLTSVDLDSFPLPPSSNNALRHHARCRRSVVEAPVRLAPSDAPHTAPARPCRTRNGDAPTRRRHLVDVVADIPRASKRSSIDSALVDAISRTVIQQLRLFSVSKQGKHAFRSQRSSPRSRHGHSRTSSQREALDRFTRDLSAYAENTGARGRVVQSTPVSTAKSGETLHTVSALLPFRPEFRAAGLAVTSKDQASPPGGGLGLDDGTMMRHYGRYPPMHASGSLRLPQVDGPRAEMGSSTNTEISFAPSQDVDELRYALIDEAPVRKHRNRRARKARKPKSHCLPCFPGGDEPMTTDTEWAHFRPPASGSAPKPRPLAGPTSRMPPQAKLPPPPPLAGCRCPPRVMKSPSPRDRSCHGQVERRAVQPLGEGQAGGHQYRPVKDDDLPPAKKEPAYGQESQAKVDAAPGRCSGPRPRPLRTQRDRTQLDRDVKTFERQLLSPRPYQSLSSQKRSVAAQKSLMGATGAPEPVAPVAQKQSFPVSTLEQELEEAARAVAETRVPSRGGDPGRARDRQKGTPALYDANHVGFCCRAGRGLPSRAAAPPNIPKRTSSMRGSLDSVEMSLDDGAIEDRDVLRGLHVAASAACDEEVDAFVRNRTGLRIRRFLADLMALEAFGEPRPGEDSEKRVKRRRGEMKKLKKHVRRSREVAMHGGFI